MTRICRTSLLVMLLLGTACARAEPALKIESPAGALQINETVQVSVSVENIADLIGFEVHLSFDANVLEVVALKDTGFVQPDFLVQNSFDNVQGTIDYAVAQIDRPPVNGSGELLGIVFRAKAHGSSPILFQGLPAAPEGALLSDSTGTAIPVALVEGNIIIGE